LGEIPQNKPKTIDFEFKNTGKTTVIITNVKASCGCTATDYTKTPIQAGQTAKITATYNAATKGAFTKTVTVTTSAEETPKILIFKGTVIWSFFIVRVFRSNKGQTRDSSFFDLHFPLKLYYFY
jgi:hypothetical protein